MNYLYLICNKNTVNKWYKNNYTTILYNCTGIIVQNPMYR